MGMAQHRFEKMGPVVIATQYARHAEPPGSNRTYGQQDQRDGDHGRRFFEVMPLVLCAAISACGLAGMALSGTLQTAIAAYALFGIASSVFLALHSAQTLRVLPRSDRRGRDLGLFNLTNTLPSLIMPWLTLALVPWFGFTGLFVVFAALALGAGLLLVPLTRRA